jgi:hypothetical protein
VVAFRASEGLVTSVWDVAVGVEVASAVRAVTVPLSAVITVELATSTHGAAATLMAAASCAPAVGVSVLVGAMGSMTGAGDAEVVAIVAGDIIAAVASVVATRRLATRALDVVDAVVVISVDLAVVAALKTVVPSSGANSVLVRSSNMVGSMSATLSTKRSE